jgi:hypothetical protein
VAWSLAQPESHAATRMTVHELVAEDEEIRRALLGRIGAQRDQVAEVALEIDAADPLDRALLDLDRGRFGTHDVEHALGVVASGPMVRIHDVARALTARRYARDGVVELALEGEEPLRLEVTGGAATVAAGTGKGLHLRRDTLAAIAYGALGAADAVRLGWARGDAPAIAAAGLFEGPPYFALDAF